MPGAALNPAPAFDDVRLIGGNINGCYTLADKSGIQCFACRAQSISAQSIVLSAPVSGPVGAPVALHFDDFGLLKGRISRLMEFGFVLDLLATDDERANIAATIRWLRKRAMQSAPDRRRYKRMLPRSPPSTSKKCWSAWTSHQPIPDLPVRQARHEVLRNSNPRSR